MSWPALGWASHQKPGRVADKMVLIALADRHSEETGIAYPSIAWLAEFSCLDRKTVVAALDRLEAAGLITDSGLRMGKTKQVKAYTLNLNSPEKGNPKTEPLEPKDTVFSVKQSQKRDTEPSKEPLELAKANPKRAKPSVELPEWMPLTKWEAFLRMRHKMRKDPTDDAVALLIAKLSRWRDRGHDPGVILDNSTENNWIGIFEPKVTSNDNAVRTTGSQGGNRSSLAKAIDEGLDWLA